MKRVLKQVRRACRSVRSILHHPLARRNRASAFWRYTFFHLRHLIFPGPAVYAWVGGLQVLADRGLDLGAVVGNLYKGLQDFEDMSFLLHFLRPGDLFVDVGANVGTYTLLASGICRARTVAAEPSLRAWNVLMAHVHLNGLNFLVDAYPLALGESSGTLYLRCDLGSMNRVATEEEILNAAAQLSRVPVITLDELVAQRPTVAIKIDVEGYEGHVLRGGLKTLESDDLKAVIIELHCRERCHLDEVHRVLMGMGFHPMRYDPFARTFASLQGFRQDQYNTLYVRDLPFVRERVREGPVIEVRGVRF